MTTKEFISSFAASDLANVIEEIKLDRLRRRLQENGHFAKYSQDVTAEQAAFFVLCGAMLLTLYKGEEPEKGANWWVSYYWERLTRTETINPLTGKMEPLQTSLHALTNIIANPGNVVEILIDKEDGAICIRRADGREEEYNGIYDGNKFYQAAQSLAIIRRGGVALLHSWTKQ